MQIITNLCFFSFNFSFHFVWFRFNTKSNQNQDDRIIHRFYLKQNGLDIFEVFRNSRAIIGVSIIFSGVSSDRATSEF